MSSKKNNFDVNVKIENRPTGGFPLIFLCDKSIVKREKENQNREFVKKGKIVSIRQILEKKKQS